MSSQLVDLVMHHIDPSVSIKGMSCKSARSHNTIAAMTMSDR
jgi:hypothetical protein